VVDRFVLDASAVGAILFREPQTHEIEKEIENGIWLAPTLLDYEVGSIYLKKIAKYPSLKRDLEKSYHLFSQLPIDRVEIPVAPEIRCPSMRVIDKHERTWQWKAWG